VVGLDFDPSAVQVARSRGLDVRQGSVEVIDPAKESFDGITLRHVIEHVHDPLAVLRQCHALLKPGGWIWIETPNIDAQGHARYGANWRDLDPPRHLVLFSRDALFQALVQAGFHSIADQPYRPLCSAIFAASEAIANGSDAPFEASHHSQHARRAARSAEWGARRDPAKREFITAKAWKSA
jgi:2-polyprenyl-3-methyl-5-hydroxy-6-metoxy-1,4-benzoquinol methylase